MFLATNKKMAQSTKNKQKGASLVEFMMYLGLAALVIVAAVNWYRQSKLTSDVTATIQNLGVLTASIRNSFAQQGTYEGLANTIVLSSNGVPESMRVAGDQNLIRSNFATDGVDILPRNVGGIDEDGFGLTFKQVPVRACNELVQKTYRTYFQIDVNGTVINPSNNIADIQAACGFAESNGTNQDITIEWLDR
jgi:type II secretory pathway pseudopilin PulG